MGTPYVAILSALLVASVCSQVNAQRRVDTRSYVLLQNASSETDGLPQQSDYQKWVRRYKASPLPGHFGDDKWQTMLVVTAIEGDDPALDKRTAALPGQIPVEIPWSPIINYGCYVSTIGQVSCYRSGASGLRGGDYQALSSEDLEKLRQLIAKLPDDHAYLPPPNRRLVLQTPEGDHTLVRVYDRANAPEDILEILRLAGSNISPWLVTSEPQSKLVADEFRNYGAFTLTPEGKIVSSGMYGPFKFWDVESLVEVDEIRQTPTPFKGGTFSLAPIAGLTISPDGLVVVVEGWGVIDLLDGHTWRAFRRISEPMPPPGGRRHALTHPQFTLDGHFLLLQSDEPALQVFDTRTWEQVPTLPELPTSAVAYFPSATRERAIYTSRSNPHSDSQSGEIKLWDPIARRDVATLDGDSHILRLAFSPDNSLVAIVTGRELNTAEQLSSQRIRVWNTESGELVRELLPFERSAYYVDALVWAPGGKYLLAPTGDRVYRSRGIGVWSIQSGRHRAELTGCSTDVFGVVVLPDANRVAAGCADGIIRVWDLRSVIGKVDTLEMSLTRLDHAGTSQ